MDDTDYDDLLDSLLGECTLEDPLVKEESQINDMIIEEPVIIKEEPVILRIKPYLFFNCIEDNETYYPDVVARRRYGGYKPPKAPKVKFIDPFAKKVETPAYSKQLYDSMERLRIRENDKRDTKIKYIKKKYPN